MIFSFTYIICNASHTGWSWRLAVPSICWRYRVSGECLWLVDWGTKIWTSICQSPLHTRLDPRKGKWESVNLPYNTRLHPPHAKKGKVKKSSFGKKNSCIKPTNTKKCSLHMYIYMCVCEVCASKTYLQTNLPHLLKFKQLI